MQRITLKTVVACLIAVITTAAHAQIVLHEATDVTQTKATLSADFPNLNVEHGFQYKYGTLPEIDEFSRLALSSVSDPVQINTTGNAWSARTVKGWVESKSNLSVGQASIMSAKVKFSEPTTVTFEWSVDSEEGIGILSFIVDGKTVREISGAVDFTQVSYQATAGEHTLQWQYKKTAATNVGLDLGMVRNIDLQNTTEGEWITKISPISEFQLSNLYPGQNYVYRAFSNYDKNIRYSKIGGFKSTEVMVDNPNITDIKQASASLNCNSTYGDAIVETGFICSSIQPESDFSPFAQALLSDDTYGRSISITKTYHWKVGDNFIYHNSYHVNPEIYVYVNLLEDTEISFEWRTGGATDDCLFYVDGVKKGSVWGTTYKHYKCKIPAGSHTLKWSAAYVNTYNTAYTCIRNLSIPGLGYSDILGSTSITDAKISRPNDIFIGTQAEFFSSSLSGLRPNTKYYVQSFVIPNYSSELSASWIESKSRVVTFVTENVHPQILSATNITQTTAIINGELNFGDAIVKSAGLQYKDATGTRWSDYPKDITETELSQNITRLKPNTTYNYRSYIQAQDCDTVFSEIGEFTTLAVEALKPTAIKLAQHEAELQGKVRFGDASIYQRGMQFRKSGETEWEEVEDGGNDSIYTLVKKNLEMGMKYEVRTYIQPAGCNIIYSDILKFTTLDNYFTGYMKCPRTQTTVEFSATLADVDEGTAVEEYGFEYYLASDGFFENAESFIKSDVIRIPVTPENGQITTTVTGLTPYYGLRFRAYIKINGEYVYYTGYKNMTWDYAGTDRAAIKVSIKELTQTSVTLKLDATQDGDAVVSQIEYAFANSVQDTEEYQVCGNELTINNLTPDTKYNLRFRGTVNGRLCPLLHDITWDYSWFEFTTKAVTISATFTNITQTKATMKVSVNAGDAEVTDLKYRLNYGEYTDCEETVNFNGLTPGTQYTIRFSGKVNGKDCYWETQPNTSNAYKFTTKAVSVYAHSSAIEQTSATISWSYNCGDATYVSSGIEYGTTTAMTKSASNEDGEIRLTELTPNTTYYYCTYVETEEGGKVYSSRNSFSTSAISCATLPVSNISNRSATMNGTIDCDGYSSAEFGFQWKQMDGWNSDPAFTKGVKKEDGSISVALVNGILEPNTDYQYRAAVRYKGNIYYASNWETFRTESEFVYYPANVYTIYRTDRENNCLVLCGYYVAGSEDIVAQGYEYWNTSAPAHSNKTYAAANNVIQITTDESMQYSLDLKTLVDGNYSVRAFVKTSSGATIYGETLAFGVQGGAITGIYNVETEGVSFSISNGILSIYNAANMSCTIYNIQGQIVECRQSMTDNEQFYLASGIVYIVRLSNGIVYKIRI